MPPFIQKHLISITRQKTKTYVFMNNVVQDKMF